MPEMRFRIRWPGGGEEACYSPSLVIKDFFEPGRAYPIRDFLDLSREALTIASERVKAKYGRPCSLALGQLDRIEMAGRAFTASPDATVTVVSFHE